MSYISIKPKKLMGEVNIPPSKSMAHRAVICAALSSGRSIIENIDFSDDILATIDGMRALGANIKSYEDSLVVDGIFSLDNSLKPENSDIAMGEFATIDCNESGSTLRFLVPISIIKENNVNFIGKGNLGKRPLTPFYEIFDEQGILYKYNEGEMDLRINGRLKGGEFRIKGNISSQFISGLLFSLPLLEEDSKIIITTELESKAYIDLTLSMLERFGIEIINNQYKEFIVKGNQSYVARNYRVEGDYSQAAFFLSAAALGNEVICKDLDFNSLQGDKETLEILERMGCNIIVNGESTRDVSVEVSAFGVIKSGNSIDLQRIKSGNGIELAAKELRATVIDGSQCPDVIPILTLVASLAKGETHIIKAGRLRIKECDRLKAITTELNKLGANIIELEDGLIIKGVEGFKGAMVDSFDDHRIAMTLAIASTRCQGEVIIKNPECVKKSYPDFWEDFKRIGGELSEWSLGE